MTASIDYLEAAKIEELTSQLRDEGYRVTVHPSGEDQGYDLVAEKDNKKVAVEVKVNALLRESAETIKALRRRAVERGYDEFRLVVVSPPHETAVTIQGLDEKLLYYFRDNPKLLKHVPKWLPQLPYVEGVRHLEIDAVSITADGTQVDGNGVVRVADGPPAAAVQNNIPLNTFRPVIDFPFSFEVKLDTELKITGAKIDIDVSGWD
jgi:hypothetical protein